MTTCLAWAQYRQNWWYWFSGRYHVKIWEKTNIFTQNLVDISILDKQSRKKSETIQISRLDFENLISKINCFTRHNTKCYIDSRFGFVCVCVYFSRLKKQNIPNEKQQQQEYTLIFFLYERMLNRQQTKQEEVVFQRFKT